MDRTVRRIIWLQVGVTALIAALLLGIKGSSAAVSALLGGSVGFLTSLVYAIIMVRPDSEEPRDLLRAHIRAEAFKLLATVILFVAVFTLFKEISAVILVLTFAATLLVNWVSLLMIQAPPKSPDT